MFKTEKHNLCDIIDPKKPYDFLNLLGHQQYTGELLTDESSSGILSFAAVDSSSPTGIRSIKFSGAALYSLTKGHSAEEAARRLSARCNYFAILNPDGSQNRTGFVYHDGWAKLEMAKEFGDDWEAQGYKLEEAPLEDDDF